VAASAPIRTLIFGGTFDPPHRAHVELPQAAARELGCEKVVYVPAAINPLKSGPDHPRPTPAQDRLAMLRLALRDVPHVEISELELNRKGPSYTIDTLRALRSNPSTSVPPDLFLLIGADQALDFHRWRDWQEIIKLARPAVMLRPPWTLDGFTSALCQRYSPDESQQWLDRTLRTLPVLDITATDIRRSLRDGQPVTGMLASGVESYIRTHHLYQ
jgi:nicotinate-nucleotide adenylyltransferase